MNTCLGKNKVLDIVLWPRTILFKTWSTLARGHFPSGQLHRLEFHSWRLHSLPLTPSRPPRTGSRAAPTAAPQPRNKQNENWAYSGKARGHLSEKPVQSPSPEIWLSSKDNIESVGRPEKQAEAAVLFMFRIISSGRNRWLTFSIRPTSTGCLEGR